MSTIGQQLIEAIRATAANDPDRVMRDGGAYWNLDGTPCCLVGHGLASLGLLPPLQGNDREEFIELDEHWNYEGFTALLNKGGLPGLEDLDDIEILWIREAQIHQDEERTWGRSVELADSLAEAYGGLK